MIQRGLIETDWGWFGYLVSDAGLLATVLPGPRGVVEKALARRASGVTRDGRGHGALERAVRDYFKGKRVVFDVPLDLRSISPFRRRVLVECSKIPWGETCSYADLARAAGSPRATRAAGSAMAHNPMPLVIPCHRVLASNGGVGGFSSSNGVREKIRMLTLEGAWSDGMRSASTRPETRKFRKLQPV